MGSHRGDSTMTCKRAMPRPLSSISGLNKHSPRATTPTSWPHFPPSEPAPWDRILSFPSQVAGHPSASPNSSVANLRHGWPPTRQFSGNDRASVRGFARAKSRSCGRASFSLSSPPGPKSGARAGAHQDQRGRGDPRAVTRLRTADVTRVSSPEDPPSLGAWVRIGDDARSQRE